MSDTPTTTVTIAGLKEALRELNDIDKKARRDLTRDYQRVCKPVIDAAKAAIPRTAPISGWERKWTTKSGRQMLPWSGSVAAKFVKAKVSGKKPREYNGQMTNLAVFSIAFAGSINTVYDLAGRTNGGATKAGQNMIRGLEARKGRASRVLWPAYEANKDEVEQEVARIIDDLMREVSRAI